MILVLILVCFMLLCLLFSAYKSKEHTGKYIPPSSINRFSVAERSGDFKEIMSTVLGTSLGGAITVGFIGLVYEGGIFFYISGLSFLVGLTILFSLIGVIRRQATKNEYCTIEDYLSRGVPILKCLFGIINIFAFLGLYVAQLIALKILFGLVLPEYENLLFVIIVGVLTLYTCVYGLIGIMANDAIQSIAVFLWLGVIVYIIFGDWDMLAKIGNLPAKMFNGLYLGELSLAIIVLFLPFTALARADHWQRIVSAKSDAIARKSYGTLIVVMLFVYTLLLLAGLYLASNYPGLNSNNAPYVFLDIIKQNKLIYTLALIGLVSAIVSTADSFLNITSLSFLAFINGISKKMSSSSDKAQGVVYRLLVVVVTCISCTLLFNHTSLGTWVILATSVVVIIVPSFLGNLFSQKNNIIPSVISLSFGIMAYAISLFFGADAKVAFVPGAIAALFGYVATLFPSMKMSKIRNENK